MKWRSHTTLLLFGFQLSRPMAAIHFTFFSMSQGNLKTLRLTGFGLFLDDLYPVLQPTTTQQEGISLCKLFFSLFKFHVSKSPVVFHFSNYDCQLSTYLKTTRRSTETSSVEKRNQSIANGNNHLLAQVAPPPFLLHGKTIMRNNKPNLCCLF